MTDKSHTMAGVLCGAGAGALWGLVFLAPELVREFSPLHMAMGRYLLFGLLSAALLAPRWHAVRPGLTRAEWPKLVTLALTGNIVYYMLLSAAVQLGGIAITTLIIGFLPLAVTLIGRRDRNAVPLRRLTLSLVFCVAGALCIGWQALVAPAPEAAHRQLTGVLCALGALISWTWFAVANSRWLVRLQQITPHEWNLLTGLMTGALAIALVPLAIVTGSSSHGASDWLRLAGVSAGLALFASILGNALWNRMSRLLPLTLTGQMILFETLFALLYGFLWEGRWPALTEAAAFVFLTISVTSCVTVHQKAALAAAPS